MVNILQLKVNIQVKGILGSKTSKGSVPIREKNNGFLDPQNLAMYYYVLPPVV